MGALGPVFRTYEPTRDRLVAVKVFRLDITPEQAQALAEELSRAAEASLFHPSIVEPIAAGVEGTAAYRAEEYVAAESLDVAMRHYAPAAIDKALPFITQLAGAIDFARAAGIGHGALHPRDIFVTPDEARATGFGVVEALERIGLRAPVRRPYSPPERIEGGAWSTSADVFSLAAIAYELLTGRRPAGTGDRIGPLDGQDPGTHPDRLHQVLARAMDDDPAERYPTALAFASALEAAARGEHLTGAMSEVDVIATAPFARASAPEEVPRDASLAEERVADDTYAGGARDDQDFSTPPPVEDSVLLSDELREPATDRFADAEDEFVPAAGPAAFAGHVEADDLRGFPAPPVDTHRDRLEAGPSSVLHLHESAIDDVRSPAAAMAERPRPAALLLAMALIFGLLLGFAAGYVKGSRDAEQAALPHTPQEATRPAQTAPVAPGQAWSEQAVKPPAPAATGQPPSAAPPIPADAPGGARAETAPARASTGTLIVRSEPAGASVTLNGRWRGRTPLTLERLPLARYIVRVVHPGFTVAREEVALSPSSASRTVTVTLKAQRAAAGSDTRGARGAAAPAAGRRPASASPPASRESDRASVFTGTIFVASNPSGARVFVDGKPVGTAPLRVPEVPIGAHVVRMELPDHRTWSTSARVVAGQDTRVTGSLERIR